MIDCSIGIMELNTWSQLHITDQTIKHHLKRTYTYTNQSLQVLMINSVLTNIPSHAFLSEFLRGK